MENEIPIVFGGEWELGFLSSEELRSATDDVSVVFSTLKNKLVDKLPYKYHGPFNVFTPYFLYYFDMWHPEIAAVEMYDPEHFIILKRFIISVLKEISREIEPKIKLFLNNCFQVELTDVGPPSANTWGSHESYAVTDTVFQRRSMVVPFLATRSILCGSGFIGPSCMYVSPRLKFTDLAYDGCTTSYRALFSTARDESLMQDPKFRHRLHLICGDAVRSDWSEYLRFATTALVLLLIQSDHSYLNTIPVWHKENVKTKLDKINIITGVTEPHVSKVACEIQRIYCDAARRFVDKNGSLPKWCVRTVQIWDEVLNALERDIWELADRLDYVIKLQLFSAVMQERGYDSWKTLRNDKELYLSLLYLNNMYHYLGTDDVYDRLISAGHIRSFPTYDLTVNDVIFNSPLRVSRRAKALTDGSDVSHMTWNEMTVNGERLFMHTLVSN